MDINWTDILTQIITVALPIILAAVFSWIGVLFAKLKKAEGLDTSQFIVTQLVERAVEAAEKELSGSDGADKYAWVATQVRAAIGTNLPIDDAQLTSMIKVAVESFLKAKSDVAAATTLVTDATVQVVTAG